MGNHSWNVGAGEIKFTELWKLEDIVLNPHVIGSRHIYIFTMGLGANTIKSVRVSILSKFRV